MSLRMPGVIASVLLAIAVAAACSLVSGAAYLEFVLPGGLPVGNAIAALTLICVAAVPALFSVRGSALRRAALVTLAAAVAWLPVSIGLAGNLRLNFAGWRGPVWLGVSLVVLVAALCTLACALVGRLLALRKRARLP
jgi:hypothetical protein